MKLLNHKKAILDKTKDRFLCSTNLGWGKEEIQVIPPSPTCLAPLYSPEVPLYTIV